jgi:hypothetical protein
MGWAIYQVDGRDAGYSVPAICDHPDCNEEIDRGVSYVCGDEPGGGEHGCGLYFCGEHLLIQFGDRSDGGARRPQLCHRCIKRTEDDDDFEPYEPKPDSLKWVGWKLQHESWQQWRDENPEEVAAMQKRWDTEPRSDEFMIEFAELY